MTQPMERRPWTLAEFRAMKSGAPVDVLRPLLKICNAAIRNGLTRKQVEDTFSRLYKRYPKEMPVAALLEELIQQIDDDPPKQQGEATR